MKKTILFGGSGFLGDIFLRDYPEIISVGRTKPDGDNVHIDLPDMDNLDVLDDLEFDNVIFLVGNSDHHHIDTQCMVGFHHNVIPLKKILHYLQKRKINRFVCFTSILLYGSEPKGRPVHENDTIYPYQSEYIFSKYMAEQVVEFYKNRVSIVNVRLCNIYGDTKLIRPDFIPTLVKKSLTEEDITIWSDKPIRDFIFTSDAAEAIMSVLETDYVGNINLGTGKKIQISEVVKIIEKISGKKITSLDKEVGGVMDFEADISLLQGLTNWKPKHTIEEGLQKTYDAMKLNLEKI